MRPGFVAGVLLFGLLAATAFSAYVRVAMGLPWLQVLRAFLVIFGAIALFPLGYRWTRGAFWTWLFRWPKPPRRGDAGGPGRDFGPRRTGP